MDINSIANQPLISVIVPVYNVEQYLARCLDSLIRQTYTNIEIIVVNDGSTDGSLTVCRAYAEKDKRIKVIDQQNKGLSGARNTGLKHYEGEYVSFVDSDDWVHKDMIMNMYDILIANDADMSLCGSQHVTVDFLEDKPYYEKEVVYNQDQFMRLFLSRRYTACWSRLFRREVIQGVVFPEGLNCEDFIYMYKVILNVKSVAANDLPLYYYYIRENSIVTEKFSLKKFDQFYSAKKLYELVCEHTPEYRKQSVVRLAESLISLISSSRKYNGYGEKERELVSYLRHNAGVLVFNNNVFYKQRVILFIDMLPRFLSVGIHKLLSHLLRV